MSQSMFKVRRKRLTPAQRNVLYLRVFERDNWVCRRCGVGTSGLHPHHIKFQSQQGEDTEENLLSLCPGCHDIIHRNKAERTKLYALIDNTQS